MRTLFVMDPIEKLNHAGDSTWMLMAESVKRGFPIAWCGPEDLLVDDRRPAARVRPVVVSEDPAAWEQEAPRLEPLDNFDCIWMRKDPPFDMAYVFSTYILDLVRPHTLVLNDPRSIKLCNEKMFALQFPELCPPTRVTNRTADARAFAAEHGRVVMKPWDGNGGRGVVVTEHGDPNFAALFELETGGDGKGYCIVQRYLPDIKLGDKRIIFVDGEPLGAILRVPGEDDHRGNMHVGASAHATALTARDQEICARIGPRLREMGLVFVGIDVIGQYVTEINVTSPTGLQEYRRLSGVRLEPLIIDAALRRLGELRG